MSKMSAGTVVMTLGVVGGFLNHFQTLTWLQSSLRAHGAVIVADVMSNPMAWLALLLVGFAMVFDGWRRRLKGGGPPNGGGDATKPIIKQSGGDGAANIGGNVGGNLHVGDIHHYQSDEPADPKLIVESCEVVLAIIGIPHQRAPKAYFVEVRFVNEPYAGSRRRQTALGVVGHITFMTDGLKPLFGPMPNGRWAHVPEPQHERLLDQSSRTNVPPDGVPKALNLAIKLVSDADVYGFCNKSIVSGDIWRLPEFKLGVGLFIAKVRLLGENVDQEFWFELSNVGGVGAPIGVREISKPPIAVSHEDRSGQRDSLPIHNEALPKWKDVLAEQFMKGNLSPEALSDAIRLPVRWSWVGHSQGLVLRLHSTQGDTLHGLKCTLENAFKWAPELNRYVDISDHDGFKKLDTGNGTLFYGTPLDVCTISVEKKRLYVQGHESDGGLSYCSIHLDGVLMLILRITGRSEKDATVVACVNWDKANHTLTPLDACPKPV